MRRQSSLGLVVRDIRCRGIRSRDQCVALSLDDDQAAQEQMPCADDAQNRKGFFYAMIFLRRNGNGGTLNASKTESTHRKRIGRVPFHSVPPFPSFSAFRPCDTRSSPPLADPRRRRSRSRRRIPALPRWSRRSAATAHAANLQLRAFARCAARASSARRARSPVTTIFVSVAFGSTARAASRAIFRRCTLSATQP